MAVCTTLSSVYPCITIMPLPSSWASCRPSQCQGHNCRGGDPVISLQKGVYQGDPLSVVIFNTVMNTLLDTISLRIDLGYRFSNSLRRVNILQYADDTCLVADSSASCQYLVATVSDWLQWSGMVAKIPTCQCLSLQGSTGRLADPHLTLDGVPIPFSTDAVQFLGMEVQVPKNNGAAREAVLSKLQRMLMSIDETPLTRKQKLMRILVTRILVTRIIHRRGFSTLVLFIINGF